MQGFIANSKYLHMLFLHLDISSDLKGFLAKKVPTKIGFGKYIPGIIHKRHLCLKVSTTE
jgi:hypothetical protein